jgi:ATP-dependent Clp protease ATP-binding subunit ClpB
MQNDRLTLKSREAIQDAQREAQERHHQEIDLEHLLWALARQPDSLVPELIRKLGAHPDRLAEALLGDLAQRRQVFGDAPLES